ncbi:MAG: hypothetical protein Q9M94_02320 [Candidatus Gracilibacteria bacterium]|nr:hypothetical protein [Candidatus Gracilibacteria bacterium]
MFGKKKVKKIDNLVTGLIIGTAVASIFGLTKTKKGKEVTSEITKKSKGVFGKVYEVFGKTMCKLMSKNKK